MAIVFQNTVGNLYGKSQNLLSWRKQHAPPPSPTPHPPILLNGCNPEVLGGHQQPETTPGSTAIGPPPFVRNKRDAVEDSQCRGQLSGQLSGYERYRHS